MTAREYATFRAGALVASGSAGVAQAIAACPAAASTAAASLTRTVVPMFQSCPGGGTQCYYHWYEAGYDSIGNTASDSVNGYGKINAAVGYNSSGTQTTTGGRGGVVTVTNWEPWGNGGKGGTVSFPAGQAITSFTDDSGHPHSVAVNIPQPTSVPQSGWVVIPGTPFWMDIVSTTYGVIQLDGTGQDFVTVTLTPNNGYQTSWHVIYRPTGQVVTWTNPIVYPAGSGGNTVFDRVRPDLGPFGTALFTAGTAMVTIGTGIFVGAILGAAAGTIAVPVAGALAVTAIVYGYTGVLAIYTATKDYTVSEIDPEDDWMFAEGDLGDMGGGCAARPRGSGGTAPLCDSSDDFW